MQAEPEDGRVHVRAEGLPGGRVALEVSDRGSGIPPDVVERALEPFFTTKARGTGLGLAIVSRVVEAHAGELSIESKAGVGTTIRIRLPGDLKA